MQTEQHSSRDYARNIQQRLQDTIGQLRSNLNEVEEPQLKALFETSAEVLGGLSKAFQDYERQNEAAWQSRGGPQEATSSKCC